MALDPRPDAISQPFKIGRLLFNAEPRVLAFIQEHIAMVFEPNGEYRCVGVLDNDDLMIAGACYHDFNFRGALFSGATSRPGRWATKKVLRGLFAFGFDALELHRLTGLVAETNKPSINWNLKAGFRQEGRMREAAQDGSNIIIFGLLKSECRWN